MISETKQLLSESILDELVEEICRRLQLGEAIELEELVAQHPDLADRIRRLFPTLMAMAMLDPSGPLADESMAVLEEGEREPLGSRTLGDFRIIRQIGRGGMGVVYEAQQLSVSRPVALKVLPLASLIDERALVRFRNEVRAAATLEHPGIVSVYSVGEERGVHYYAMQLVRGQSLAAVIRALREVGRTEGTLNGSSISQVVSDEKGAGEEKGTEEKGTEASGPVPVSAAETRAQADSQTQVTRFDQTFFQNAARLGIRAAEALQHAHEHGVVHRDIKPGNLLLDRDGQLFVADFGLARIEADAGVTMTGDVLGTLRYMSPEQVLGNRVEIDHRTDIYSLGATLYEMVTLQPMVGGEDRPQLIRSISFDEPVPARRINPQIPADLETIIFKAVRKNPAERYASAAEFRDDLTRFLENRPIVAKRPTIWQRASKWSYRHAGLLAAVLLTGIASLACGLILTWQAYQRATSERIRAQSNYRMALDTLDEVFEVAWHLERTPQLEKWQRTVLENALTHYQRFVGENADDVAVHHEMLRALDRQVQIHEMLENDQSLIEAGEEALQRGDEMVAEGTATVNDRRRLATIARRLADAYHNRGDFSQAEEMSRAAHRGLTEALGVPQAGVATYREMARLLLAQAARQQRGGGLTEAVRTLTLARTHIDTGLIVSPEDPTMTAALIAVNVTRGEVMEDLGDQPAARSLYEEAIRAADLLPPSRKHRILQTAVRDALGALLLKDHANYKEARTILAESVELYEGLVDEFPLDPYHSGDFAKTLHNLARVERTLGDTERSRELLTRATKLQGYAIAHKQDNLRYQIAAIKHRSQLGQIAESLGDGEEAEEAYRQCLVGLQELVRRFDRHHEIMDLKAYVHLDLAGLLNDRAESPGMVALGVQAENELRPAIAIYEELLSKTQENTSLQSQLRTAFNFLSRALLIQARYAESEAAAERVMELIESQGVEEAPELHGEIGATLSNIAMRYVMEHVDDHTPDLAAQNKAEQLLRRAIEHQDQALAGDLFERDRRRFETFRNNHRYLLASTLYDQGKYLEAKGHFKAALDNGFGNGAPHPHSYFSELLVTCPDESFRDYRLAVKHATLGTDPKYLGIAHYRLGEYKAARTALEQALNDGANIDFVVAYYLAMALYQIDPADDVGGHFSKSDAEEMYRRIVWMQHEGNLKRTGGPDPAQDRRDEELREEAAALLQLEHPLIGFPSNAELLLRQGLVNKATETARRELENRTKIYGPKHSTSIAALRGYGKGLWKLGQRDEAIEKLEQAYKLAVEIESFQTAFHARNEVGVIHYEQQNYKQARQVWEATIADFEQLLGPEAEDTLMVKGNFVKLLRDTGELSTAESVAEEVVKGRRDVLGPHHEQTLDAMGDLIAIYLDQEDLDAADLAADELVNTVEVNPGIGTPEHAEALILLAGIRSRQDDPTAARQLNRRALQIYRAALRGNATRTLSALNLIGVNSLDLADWDEAKYCFGSVLETTELMEKESPLAAELQVLVAGVHCNLAEALFHTDQLQAALNHADIAVTSLEGDENPGSFTATQYLVNSLERRASIHSRQGNRELAVVDLNAAIAKTESDERRASLRRARETALAQSGHFEEISQSYADDLDHDPLEGEVAYETARVFAAVAEGLQANPSGVDGETQQVKKYSEAAIRLLTHAAKLGHFAIPAHRFEFESDPTFDALRDTILADPSLSFAIAPDLENADQEHLRLTWIPIPHYTEQFAINDINRHGMVVGQLRYKDGTSMGFVYDVKARDFNEADDISWRYSGAWHESAFESINDRGQVLGYVKAEKGVRRAVVGDLSVDPPVLQLLPDFYGREILPRSINANGVVLGVYQDDSGQWDGCVLNLKEAATPGDIAPRALRLPLGDDPKLWLTDDGRVVAHLHDGSIEIIDLSDYSRTKFDDLPGARLAGVTGEGDLAGRLTIPGAGESDSHDFAFSFGKHLEWMALRPSSVSAITAIDGSESQAMLAGSIADNGRPFLRDEDGVLIRLDDLVVADGRDDLDFWREAEIEISALTADSDSASLMVVGRAGGATGRGFVLLPSSPQRP